MGGLAPDALAGRRCLVTGGSRGIGAAIATELAALGGDVVIAANDPDGLDETSAAIREAGGSVTPVFADLMDPDSIAGLLATAGDVQVLVNNAAPDQKIMPFLDGPDSLWELMLGLIVWAPLRLVRVVGRSMAGAASSPVGAAASAPRSRPSSRRSVATS